MAIRGPFPDRGATPRDYIYCLVKLSAGLFASRQRWRRRRGL